MSVTKIDSHHEAFDWAFAIWYWLSHHHEGIRCEKYAVMSNMPEKHKMSNIPSIDFGDNDDMDYYGAIEIYHQIDESNWKDYNNEFERYMEYEWENDT